jgi:transcriptional regulator
MYIPRRYEMKKEEVPEFIRNHSFGVLVTADSNKPVATHIPFVLIREGEEYFLEGHISKGNEQKHQLVEGSEVMVLFHGPHAYISPRWYTSLNVPTWNYQSVHVYGILSLQEGDTLKDSLARLVDQSESGNPQPMSMQDIPDKIFADDFRGIIGFRIKINHWDAASKLSQNRDEQSFLAVIQQLESSDDSNALEIAKAMRRIYPELFSS